MPDEARVVKGPDDYWKRPSFARKYVMGNTEGLRANPGAVEFSATCMLALGQGIQYLSGEPAAILDMGCGHATRTAALRAMFGCRVVGADYSEPMIREATNIMAELPEDRRVELVHADVNSLPFADGEFDAATTYGLLMSLPDAQKGVAELLRVTKFGIVAIEECAAMMEDGERREWDNVRTRVFPGRIYWHDYLATFRAAKQVIAARLPVPESWSLGTPPVYGRFIVVK